VEACRFVEFDLSTFTYPQFLAFFFERPVVSDIRGQYDLFRSGIDGFVALNPAIVLAHLQALCRKFAELVTIYSPEQLDQGLGAIFGVGIDCQRYLFDASVDIKLRTDCIESMYPPFREVVARHAGDITDRFYWMWWDMILHTGAFYPMPKQYKYGYRTLTADENRVIDSIYHTLEKILAIDHWGCQQCALHGLGHLWHPSMEALVQGFLDEHRSEISDEDARWIEGCRESSIV
jgi:hypothetical protein